MLAYLSFIPAGTKVDLQIILHIWKFVCLCSFQHISTTLRRGEGFGGWPMCSERNTASTTHSSHSPDTELSQRLIDPPAKGTSLAFCTS